MGTTDEDISKPAHIYATTYKCTNKHEYNEDWFTVCQCQYRNENVHSFSLIFHIKCLNPGGKKGDLYVKHLYSC